MWKVEHVPMIWNVHCPRMILNPRTAGGLSHLRTAGGHICALPVNSKTTQRSDKQKKKKTRDRS